MSDGRRFAQRTTCGKNRLKAGGARSAFMRHRGGSISTTLPVAPGTESVQPDGRPPRSSQIADRRSILTLRDFTFVVPRLDTPEARVFGPFDQRIQPPFSGVVTGFINGLYDVCYRPSFASHSEYLRRPKAATEITGNLCPYGADIVRFGAV